MKLALKWLLIGLVSTVIILFVYVLSLWPGDTGIETILTTASGESFGGVIVLIYYTAGLALIIPSVIIAIVGFLIEKKRVGTKMK